eukprot:15050325-Alexandrium_andersonii.AAC.1
MSASLVGSEMCIRDRWWDWSAVRGGIPNILMQRYQERRNRGIERRTVSYTHLTLPTICSV